MSEERGHGRNEDAGNEHWEARTWMCVRCGCWVSQGSNRVCRAGSGAHWPDQADAFLFPKS